MRRRCRPSSRDDKKSVGIPKGLTPPSSQPGGDDDLPLVDRSKLLVWSSVFNKCGGMLEKLGGSGASTGGTTRRTFFRRIVSARAYWRKRIFWIDTPSSSSDNYTLRFSTSSDSCARGALRLAGAVATPSNADNKFTVRDARGLELKLRTKTSKECNDWLETLRYVIKVADERRAVAERRAKRAPGIEPVFQDEEPMPMPSSPSPRPPPTPPKLRRPPQRSDEVPPPPPPLDDAPPPPPPPFDDTSPPPPPLVDDDDDAPLPPPPPNKSKPLVDNIPADEGPAWMSLSHKERRNPQRRLGRLHAAAPKELTHRKERATQCSVSVPANARVPLRDAVEEQQLANMNVLPWSLQHANSVPADEASGCAKKTPGTCCLDLFHREAAHHQSSYTDEYAMRGKSPGKHWPHSFQNEATHHQARSVHAFSTMSFENSSRLHWPHLFHHEAAGVSRHVIEARRAPRVETSMSHSAHLVTDKTTHLRVDSEPGGRLCACSRYDAKQRLGPTKRALKPGDHIAEPLTPTRAALADLDGFAAQTGASISIAAKAAREPRRGGGDHLRLQRAGVKVTSTDASDEEEEIFSTLRQGRSVRRRRLSSEEGCAELCDYSHQRRGFRHGRTPGKRVTSVCAEARAVLDELKRTEAAVKLASQHSSELLENDPRPEERRENLASKLLWRVARLCERAVACQGDSVAADDVRGTDRR